MKMEENNKHVQPNSKEEGVTASQSHIERIR